MEFITQHPWRDLVLKPLPPSLQEQAIASDNSDWEYIDTEMTKLGTISHETVDMPDIQNRILILLSQQTKDFRLLAHLLNILQRSERPANILLAIALLADYVEAYWDIASPQKNKLRIAQMIIQRFVNAKDLFSHNAIAQEREQSISEFVRLKQVWQEQTRLCEALDKLIVSYAKSAISTLPSTGPAPKTVAENLAENSGVQPSDSPQVPRPTVQLDDSSERAWNKTLLKIAEIEAGRTFTNPISFQLRRHAVWFNISSPPVMHNDKTSVPPLPPEKISEFERELSRPTQALWLKVENTIAYSPYWLDGHYLSSLIANKLGHPVIADVVKNELKYFLARYPECLSLNFADGKPFISERSRKWINQQTPGPAQNKDDSHALNLFNEEGLQSALTFLEQTTGNEPRAICYSQLQAIRLLHQAGCHKLAKLQLENLVHNTIQLSVKEWEPSFFDSCNGLVDLLGSKE